MELGTDSLGCDVAGYYSRIAQGVLASGQVFETIETMSSQLCTRAEDVQVSIVEGCLKLFRHIRSGHRVISKPRAPCRAAR